MMLRVFSKSDHRGITEDVVLLDSRARSLSRQRVRSEQGRDVVITLPRGTVLRHGDCLITDNGTLLAVVAMAEPLSRVECIDETDQARAAYHLGNRHASIEIGVGYVAYERDHVLDALMKRSGLVVTHIDAPFQPEPGAYAAHEWGEPVVIQARSIPLVEE
ncbi:MAG TPA: urease accessory protein UreE [Polyangiaceae bacterium]